LHESASTVTETLCLFLPQAQPHIERRWIGAALAVGLCPIPSFTVATSASHPRCGKDENTPNGGTAAAAAAPAGVHASQDGLRHRKHPDDVSKKQQQQQQQEAVHPAMQASTPLAKATATGLSEIEPLPDSQQQTGPQHTQQHHSPHRQQQQHHPSNSAATEGHMQAPSGSPEAEAAAQQQWWGQPATWLNEIADEATEAAAAAQEAAAAAVHQAASTMSHAVEEAAATAAGWARSMRAVFVEPPAGWGVQEAIKQTGEQVPGSCSCHSNGI
jgi:hypothetical protein